MDPNYVYYSAQSSTPLPQTPLLVPQSAYQHPAEYLGTYPYVPYNHNWGLNEEHTLLHFANQMTGEPTAYALPAATSSPGFQCRWCTGGVPCTQAFHKFDDLIVHLRLHGVHGKADLRLVCQWLVGTECCGKKRRRDGYKRHIATHMGLSVTCTECNKSFSREDTLREHKKNDHAKSNHAVP